ncbi:MAG TPA: tetratricopeptide repeat protein, partial [Candidatus Acidoferrales bacterium]|nr:tetratricopeptide repeat protein [Candidatus Acidoferrales bacterium]
MVHRFLFCIFLLAIGISVSAQAPAELEQELERQAYGKASAGDWAAAIAGYDAALRISPRNLTAEIGLAQAYRGVHNYDEAKRVLER